MNIKRAIRIAKDKAWYGAYVKNVIKRHGSFERFLSVLEKEDPARFFLEAAFIWNDTSEGASFWSNICNDFTKEYKDNSVIVLVKENAEIPMAKMGKEVGSMFELKKALEDLGISYDKIVAEGNYYVAYKYDNKLVKEWI